MDWTQTIALGGTLIAYMTGMCVFLYRLNEKSIQEWRKEHKTQMDKMDKTLERNENHWREMFMHMSDRIDKITEKK